MTLALKPLALAPMRIDPVKLAPLGADEGTGGAAALYAQGQVAAADAVTGGLTDPLITIVYNLAVLYLTATGETPPGSGVWTDAAKAARDWINANGGSVSLGTVMAAITP